MKLTVDGECGTFTTAAGRLQDVLMPASRPLTSPSTGDPLGVRRTSGAAGVPGTPLLEWIRGRLRVRPSIVVWACGRLRPGCGPATRRAGARYRAATPTHRPGPAGP